MPHSLARTGAYAALSAALLFGLGAPVAKLLLGPVDPWLLAGLLYTGSGVGLAAWRVTISRRPVRLSLREAAWLSGAIVAGGLVAPVLLMWGLSHLLASAASLLLNLEVVFTALLAWFVFKESFDRRIALGLFLIVAGAAAISWSPDATLGGALPSLAVVGACLAWALDNNFTRAVSSADATFIAMAKGLVAGPVNVVLAWASGAAMPSLELVLAATVTGLLSYGISLVLFVIALRDLGTARTSAYFATAPFVGALAGVVLLHEPLTATLAIAATAMGAGVWLHLTERHEHVHTHVEMQHDHEHVHDEHHQHHAEPVSGAHRHAHTHDPMTHSHAHFPDEHHRTHKH